MINTKTENEIAINPSRLDYLLGLYKMSNDDLAQRISGKKRRLTGADLTAMTGKKKIPLVLLKRIDKFFERGLNWYAAERTLPEFKSSSIFYRKDKFNTELNFESRKITSKYEEKKFDILNLCSAIHYKLDRKLESYTVDSDVREVAKLMRARFDKIEQGMYEKKTLKKPQNEFGRLKAYASIIETMNVFVFEYLEHWKKTEKTNFNGFFMNPNIIVIKGQKYRRREIFALLHEFAHYLLNSEEIDDLEEGHDDLQNNKVERWCNDFVYYFLIGDYEQTVTNISLATIHNNFHEETIAKIFNGTSLSKTAIYTRLVMEHKISQKDYDGRVQAINDSIEKGFLDKKMLQQQKRDYLKEIGKTPPPILRKPIESQLLREIVTINFFEGNLNEVRVCDYLNIKLDKLDKELY